jgi:multicomponent Na+:H+ antiporter subunit B
VIDLLVTALLALLLVTAAAVAAFEDLLATLVAFGAYSLGMAMLWAVFRAPDVGLTEAAVGAGVTTALLLAVVSRTGAARPRSVRPLAAVDARSLAAAAGLVAALLWTVPALPAVGDPTAPGFQRVAPEYLARAPLAGVRNVVTAILVAYRGFDTFGEVVVVFAAGIAVLVAFDREVIR